MAREQGGAFDGSDFRQEHQVWRDSIQLLWLGHMGVRRVTRPSHRDWTRIVLRSGSEVDPLIDAGHLIRVLPDWLTHNADVHFVYPATATLAAKTRVLLDFLIGWFKPFGSRGTETLPNS